MPQIADYEQSVRLARNFFVYHFERETNDEHFLVNSVPPDIRKELRRAIKQGTSAVLVKMLMADCCWFTADVTCPAERTKNPLVGSARQRVLLVCWRSAV